MPLQQTQRTQIQHITNSISLPLKNLSLLTECPSEHGSHMCYTFFRFSATPDRKAGPSFPDSIRTCIYEAGLPIEIGVSWWVSIISTMSRELNAVSGPPWYLELELMTGALWLITTRGSFRFLPNQFSNFDVKFLCSAIESAGVKGFQRKSIQSNLHAYG